MLARIDPSDYDLSVKSAAASLDAAERQVETADLAKQARRAALRQELASKSQLEQATLTYNQAVATRDAARSTLAQARTRLVTPI